MSLILEALRKSEAERRRGSAPDVAMELPPATARRARATPAWMLPVGLLAAIALLAAWWWSRRDADADADAVPAAASQADEPRIATPAQPAASAERITVPALPGSRTCQNAATIVRSSKSPSMTAESRKARMSATASTPCASELMCCMTACVTLCT